VNKEEVIEKVILPALDEIRQDLEDPSSLGGEASTLLYGENAPLDSLGLVNLVVLLEERINDESGKSVTLVNDQALSAKNSPFRTVDSMADYILKTLEEESG